MPLQNDRIVNRPLVPLGLLLAIVALLYSNSFGNSFHFDDFHTVADNPAVRSLGNLPRILTDATAFSVLPANQTYRPVVTASLALDYALGHGYNVFWFHLSTLIWFLVLIAVLFFWAELLFGRAGAGAASAPLALLLAAWFGLHPAMAETVNYIIQRGDLYCTLGCVVALLLYARWPEGRRWGLYLLPFVLALLSKPPAVVFPVLLFLWVLLFERGSREPRLNWRRALLASLPAVGVAALLLSLQANRTPHSYAPSMLSAASYRLTQPFVWLRYAGALFLPLHLNADTDLQPLAAWSGRAVAGYLFAGGLLLGIGYAARRARLWPIAFGLLWFVLTQLPTSLYTLSEVENDHRMFFSFPGLMVAVVWGLWLGYERARRLVATQPAVTRALPRVAAVLGLLALCGYAAGVRRRNVVWHDEASLWADDVAKSPGNGRGLMNYGLTRMNAGDLTGALALFERAHASLPNYPTLEINLGVVEGRLAEAGQPGAATAAEAHFRRAIALEPGSDQTHAFYGRWLLGQGRRAEATGELETAMRLNGERLMQRDLLLSAYTQAGDAAAAKALAQSTLALSPDDALATAVLRGAPLPPVGGSGSAAAAALVNASLADYRAGRFEQSIAEAREALARDPGSAEAWNNIGAGYGGLHAWDEAIAAERRALTLNPGLQVAANNLRWFEGERSRSVSTTGAQATSAAAYIDRSLELNRAGRYQDSIAAARQALALDPGRAEAWNNIAAGEEAQGHWDEAIAAAQHALVLNPEFTLAANNLRWSEEQKAKTGR